MSEFDGQSDGLSLGKQFGVIDEAFISEHVKDFDCTWYIGEPPIMVEAVRSILHLLGVDADPVHLKVFVGY